MSRKGYVTLNKRICHAQQKDMSRSTKGYVTLNKRICHAQQKDVSRSTKGCVTLNKRMCHAQQKDMSRSTKGYVTLNKRICHAQQNYAVFTVWNQFLTQWSVRQADGSKVSSRVGKSFVALCKHNATKCICPVVQGFVVKALRLYMLIRNDNIG